MIPMTLTRFMMPEIIIAFIQSSLMERLTVMLMRCQQWKNLKTKLLQL